MAPKPRKVAVAIIICSESIKAEPQFLLVSSRKHDAYVLPKGGIEEGETAAEAAERESWEEAGLIQGSATHLSHICEIPDPSPHNKSPSKDPSDSSFVPQTVYHFELFLLSGAPTLADDWPEKDERKDRKWVKGWDALEKEVDWGRRAEVMLKATRLARERMC
ncbi:NUDIX hydrolase domain containing protein [Pseudohyphozyma bogoriensis]|nr:NUDIX hydrolase domain containing protein [Pseudohyphozyma bogoriensis]